MSNKFLTVAKFEFFEKIRTKSFILSLIITPAIIILFSLVPSMLAGRESDTTKVIGLIESTGTFFQDISSYLGQYTIDNGQPAYILVNLFDKRFTPAELSKKADSLVVKSKIEGVLLISGGDNNFYLQYRSLNTGNLNDIKRFEMAFNDSRIKHTLASAGINQELTKNITSDFEINQVRLDKYGNESKTGFLEIFFSSLFLIMILAFVVLSSGGMLVRSLVEEKSNRLIEILVSSCTPEELLTGKILGLSLLAIVQIIIWLLIGAALKGTNIIPETSFSNILPMLFYFLLAFIFYISIFVGIGSIVSTEQEAQQVTGYLSMILLLPIVFAISTIENPDSGLVRFLTYFPLTTPTIMLLKFNIKPVSAGEIMLTTGIMLFSIGAVIYLSSRIFRIGILSYGKAPSIKQIIHWIKED